MGRMERTVWTCAVVAGLCGHAATTHTLHVAAGATNTVAELLEGTVPAAGDWIEKTGAGTLVAVAAYKDTQLNWRIKEGVYYVPNAVGTKAHKGNSTLVVCDGATVNLQGGQSDVFDGYWVVSLAGQGTGEGNNLGALAIGGGMTNPSLGGNSRFELTGDTTLYSYGTMNALFSGTGKTNGSTLDMNGHTLTVRGKDAASLFRPRWKWTVKNPGPLVFRNGVFARHKELNDIAGGLPRVTLTEGAALDVYASPSLWDLVNEFSFETGTGIRKTAKYGETGAAMSLQTVIGPPTVDANVATLTITRSLVARGADLAAGKILTTENALVFADSSTLDVTDWAALSFAAGTTYVAARSSTAITGTPALSEAAARIFSLANTGKELVLTVKDNVIDVASRAPLAEGAAAAAANAAAWAALCRDVGGRDNLVFAFRAGDWSFGDALDATACTGANTTFWGTGPASLLRSSLHLGAATGVTVRGLKFADLAGPAVVATQTDGLVITDCALDGVAGTYVDGANYPFAAVNVTDLEAYANTFAHARYAAQAYLEGGSQTDRSDAQSGRLVVNIPSGEWIGWSNFVARTCLDPHKPTRQGLLKLGAGTFDPAANLAAALITNIDVRAGQYVARADTHLGVAKQGVQVRAGANLTFADATRAAHNRTIRIAGTGTGTQNPAVRFSGNSLWNKADTITWILDDDATMYNNCTGETGVFLWANVQANGHTLTLKGKGTEANFRFGRTCSWTGGGAVVVDGVSLSASPHDNNYPSVVNPTAYAPTDNQFPLFTFRNGARLMPDSHELFSLIARADFAPGTTIQTKAPRKTYAVFQELVGTPTAASTITNLVVAGSYRARAADVFAEAPSLLTAAGALTFADGATFELDDPSAARPTSTYTLCEAAGGITGKPLPAGGTAQAGWTLRADGATRLLLGPAASTVLLLR